MLLPSGASHSNKRFVTDICPRSARHRRSIIGAAWEPVAWVIHAWRVLRSSAAPFTPAIALAHRLNDTFLSIIRIIQFHTSRYEFSALLN
jgi:hypothetical protein